MGGSSRKERVAVGHISVYVDKGPDAPRPELPFVERDAVVALVRNPKTGEYLGLEWKKINWQTLVTGGIEKGQTAEEAARAEVVEETGYKNLRLVAELSRYDAKFFHGPKGENRLAHFRTFLFELVDEERDEISAEEQEKHKIVWLTVDGLKTFRLPDGQRQLVDDVTK